MTGASNPDALLSRALGVRELAAAAHVLDQAATGTAPAGQLLEVA